MRFLKLSVGQCVHNSEIEQTHLGHVSHFSELTQP